MSESHDPQRASRWEIVGAWLNLWTAPHDVVVPPPPSRRTLALLGLALLAVAAGIALLAVPALRDVRDRSTAQAQSARDRVIAARVARQRAEQRPRFGRAGSAGRAATLAALGAAIGADARERFDPDARTAACEPAPGTQVDGGRAVLDCLSVTRAIDGPGGRGALGVPYRAVADYATGGYAFCKLNPPPGEQAVIDPDNLVVLPPECGGPARGQG